MDPNQITYFAETDSRSKKIKFGIKAKDRLKHVYVIGKTGMGKSTFLENMAIQDIQNGNGIAFIDPHGGTAEKLLDYVPESRINDVLYFAPFDMEYPVSFNVMEDVGEDKRHLVVNGLMSTFEKIWVDAWSARMAYILQNTLLALLEYPGSTLLGVNRMLSDKEYRKRVVENIKDTSVKAFWVDEFGKWTEKFISEAIPAIQNKVGQFTSNPLIRNLLGQAKSSFDIRKMMDERKILIINLSKGRVGEGNANLLGSMLITKIYLAAMSRADLSESEIGKLQNFYLYVDEFQSFANKSFADILSEARKYKLNLTIAHQYIEQMEEEVRNAVFGNVGTMVTFRVGAFDAEVLEKEFAPVFTAEDLVNLGFTQIYLKLMIDGVSSAPFSATTMSPIPKPEISFKSKVIESSRKIYARERTHVESDVSNFFDEMRGSVVAIKKNTFNKFDDRSSTNIAPIATANNMKIDNSVVVINPQEPAKQPQQPVQWPQVVVKEDKNKMAFIQAHEEIARREKEAQSDNLNMVVNLKNEPVQPLVIQPQIQGNNREVEKMNIPISNESKNFNKQPNFSREPSVSLNNLKPAHEKAKIPTQENMNTLKDALSAVLKKEEIKKDNKKEEKPEILNTVNEKKPPTVNVQADNQNIKDGERKEKIDQLKNNNHQKSEKIEETKEEFPKRFVREVPEDVLRNLLKMD